MEIELVLLDKPLLFSELSGKGGIMSTKVYLLSTPLNKVAIRIIGKPRNKRITERWFIKDYLRPTKLHKEIVWLPEFIQVNKVLWHYWIPSKTYKRIIKELL